MAKCIQCKTEHYETIPPRNLDGSRRPFSELCRTCGGIKGENRRRLALHTRHGFDNDLAPLTPSAAAFDRPQNRAEIAHAAATGKARVKLNTDPPTFAHVPARVVLAPHYVAPHIQAGEVREH